jgi:hypothetical protein
LSRQIVFQASKEIHYDRTAQNISTCDSAAYYDSAKDVILFDLVPSGKSRKIRARVQISPYGRVNLYLEETLAVEDVEEILRLLCQLIVDESGSGVGLEPVTVFYSKTRPSPIWLQDMVRALKLPIRISPKRHQMVAFSIKTVRKSKISQPHVAGTSSRTDRKGQRVT